jgi:hypothetical protein
VLSGSRRRQRRRDPRGADASFERLAEWRAVLLTGDGGPIRVPEGHGQRRPIGSVSKNVLTSSLVSRPISVGPACPTRTETTAYARRPRCRSPGACGARPRRGCRVRVLDPSLALRRRGTIVLCGATSALKQLLSSCTCGIRSTTTRVPSRLAPGPRGSPAARGLRPPPSSVTCSRRATSPTPRAEGESPVQGKIVYVPDPLR